MTKAIDFEADARPTAQVDKLSSLALSRVSVLAKRQKAIEDAIAKKAEEIKELSLQLAVVSEKDLPEAMEELGIKKLTLDDGSTLTTGKEYYPSFVDEEQAFGWLRREGRDSIIKTVFAVRFGKGEDAKALALANSLEASGLAFGVKRAIHEQTFRAFAKEMSEAGKPLPEQFFKVHSITRSKIRRPKNDE